VAPFLQLVRQMLLERDSPRGRSQSQCARRSWYRAACNRPANPAKVSHLGVNFGAVEDEQPQQVTVRHLRLGDEMWPADA
jgi:hypothetical protein